MFVDSRTCHAAEVGSEIEPVRIAELLQGLLGFCGYCQDFSIFALTKGLDRLRMLVRHDHQVAAVVGIEIQDDKTVLRSVHNVVPSVLPFPGNAAKKAFPALARVLKRLDIGGSPGGKEALHKHIGKE